MPSKKPTSGRPKPSRGSSGPAWQVILEEIRSQNRTTIEEVQTVRAVLDARISSFEQTTAARFETLETAVRSNGRDLRRLETKVDKLETTVQRIDTRVEAIETKVERIDTRVEAIETKVERIDTRVEAIETKVETVDGKIDTLVPLDARVTALERRRA